MGNSGVCLLLPSDIIYANPQDGEHIIIRCVVYMFKVMHFEGNMLCGSLHTNALMVYVQHVSQEAGFHVVFRVGSGPCDISGK